jgi:formylmethanofuran dehydrogenase subunit A
MYPHLIRLLMDRSFRNDMLSTLNKSARAASILDSIDREYSLYEIAIMTRAAPAKSLGLTDRGHLGLNACADITVYNEHANKEVMFSRPEYVFKNGELVVKKGKVVSAPAGATHTVKPDFDPGIEKQLKSYFDRYHTVKIGNFKISNDELLGYGRESLIVHPCVNN